MVHLYMIDQMIWLPGRHYALPPTQSELLTKDDTSLGHKSSPPANHPLPHPDTSQIPDRSQLPRTGAARRHVGLPLRPRLSQLYLQEERRLFPYARRRETD